MTKLHAQAYSQRLHVLISVLYGALAFMNFKGQTNHRFIYFCLHGDLIAGMFSHAILWAGFGLISQDYICQKAVNYRRLSQGLF